MGVLVALAVALLVAVAYAIVVIDDRDEIGGNVLTAASLPPKAGEPFTVQADVTFTSPDFALDVEATQVLTLPSECSTTSPLAQVFAIAAVVGQNAVPTAQWIIVCPSGEWELTATVTVAITDPAFFDPDPANNSLADTLTVNVE